jgi:hypothetical protein
MNDFGMMAILFLFFLSCMGMIALIETLKDD